MREGACRKIYDIETGANKWRREGMDGRMDIWLGDEDLREAGILRVHLLKGGRGKWRRRWTDCFFSSSSGVCAHKPRDFARLETMQLIAMLDSKADMNKIRRIVRMTGKRNNSNTTETSISQRERARPLDEDDDVVRRM